MKTNIIKTLLLLVAAITTACTSDNDTNELQQPDGRTPITITADYGDAGTTRTAYTESGANISATWQEGDQILVVYDGHVSTLALTGGAGTASATFTGTIQGIGSLNVRGGLRSAAIGGSYKSTCGDIVIEGGNITAKGGSNGAGIGSGSYSSCGDITISGGNITAYGGEQGAGIGSGCFGSCGDITITGGTGTARQGYYAPYSIGKGYGPDSNCGTITIGGTVYPDDIADSPFTW